MDNATASSPKSHHNALTLEIGLVGIQSPMTKLCDLFPSTTGRVDIVDSWIRVDNLTVLALSFENVCEAFESLAKVRWGLC